jgi:hypothetical protein
MKKELPDITIIAISSVKVHETISAIQKSMEHIQFGDAKLISHESPTDLPEEIKFEQCPELENVNLYNLYTFRYLTNHVKTSHCLLVQHDSWVLNPEIWEDDWLKNDYIGAPWMIKDDAYICHDTGEHVRVGNGGFSLRSKRLLYVPEKHNLPLLQEQGWYNEDGNICVYHRKKMLELGIKFAPVEVAAKFSYENPVPENINLKYFGFHKNYPQII